MNPRMVITTSSTFQSNRGSDTNCFVHLSTVCRVLLFYFCLLITDRPTDRPTHFYGTEGDGKQSILWDALNRSESDSQPVKGYLEFAVRCRNSQSRGTNLLTCTAQEALHPLSSHATPVVTLTRRRAG